MRKIEKLDIIGCQSSQGEIREKINLIIDRLNEEEPRECEGYHPSKPDKECEIHLKKRALRDSIRYILENSKNDDEIRFHLTVILDKPDKLQCLLEWVKNDAVKEYSDFVFTNPSIILRDLTVKIKKLIDEE